MSSMAKTAAGTNRKRMPGCMSGFRQKYIVSRRGFRPKALKTQKNHLRNPDVE